MGWEDMQHTPDKERAYQNVTAKYNHARAVALAGNYDALFTVESDVIIPSMALQRMTNVECGVVYGLYCSRKGRHHWLLYTKPGSYSVKPASHDKAWCKEVWGQVVESIGAGMGCTLIHRHVLEEIPFRCPDPEVANDWYFALDCQEKGYKQMHDTGVVCGHIDGDVTYWPDPDRIVWVEG